jgi:hypothetical protein
VAISIVFIKRKVLGRMRVAPPKKTLVNKLIIRILAYSAMKIKANRPLLYSMLNPETNSDSPSARSNGERFVSAKLVINHIINTGINRNIGAT